MTEFRFIARFEKDFQKIAKKHNLKLLDKDLQRFEKAFRARGTRLTGLEGPIPGLVKKGVAVPVYKATEFRCKELKTGSKGGIRVVFAYEEESNRALYLQMYVKNKNENHDEDLMISVLKGYADLEEFFAG